MYLLALLALLPQTLITQTSKTLGDLGTPFEGSVSFYTTGNTMAQALPAPATDGLACVMRSNTALIPASVPGPRAFVERAYLYYSGNVFTKATAFNNADTSMIDKSVSLLLPGQTTALAISPEQIYVAQFDDALLGPSRKSYFYS